MELKIVDVRPDGVKNSYHFLITREGKTDDYRHGEVTYVLYLFSEKIIPRAFYAKEGLYTNLFALGGRVDARKGFTGEWSFNITKDSVDVAEWAKVQRIAEAYLGGVYVQVQSVGS